MPSPRTKISALGALRLPDLPGVLPAAGVVERGSGYAGDGGRAGAAHDAELSPDRSFGVLAPAFRGCESTFAIQEFSENGCTFFIDQTCELFGSGLEPLECCFCHHSRVGEGAKCHADLEKDWHTLAGQALVQAWMSAAGLTGRYNG